MLLADWNKRRSKVVSRGREREREKQSRVQIGKIKNKRRKEEEKKKGKRVSSRGRPGRGMVPLGNVSTDSSKSANLKSPAINALDSNVEASSTTLDNSGVN